MSNETQRSTRGIDRYSNVSSCGTRTLLFTHNVDDTKFFHSKAAERNGQANLRINYVKSKLALIRGLVFERKLRDDHHQSFIAAVGACSLQLAIPAGGVTHFPPDVQGSKSRRWADTLAWLAGAVDGGEDAAFDSAMIPLQQAQDRYLEADYLVLQQTQAGPVLYVAEAKSWPMLDGKPADPKGCGSALDQAAKYVALLRRELAVHQPDVIVSDTVMLLNPRNVGFEPVATVHAVGARLRKATDQMTLVDDLESTEQAQPANGEVELALEELRHVGRSTDEQALLETILAAHGADFDPARCATSCGVANLCHQRAFAAGDVAMLGTGASRAMGDITELDRVLELAAGAVPLATEADLAATLTRAARLLEGS